MGQRWTGLLLGMLLGSAALADGLRLVSGDDYAPFSGQGLPGGGLLTQVVQAALAESGMSAHIDWLPWNRGYLKTRLGDYDATFPYVPTAERQADFLYSAPLFVAEQRLFSRAENAIELADLPRRTGWRLCCPLGWQPPQALRTLIERGVVRRHAPQGLDECARLLLLGRDDLFIADARLGESALRASGASRAAFHRSQQVIGEETLHLIVPRQHPRAEALIEDFDRGLAALKARGEYHRLIDAYLQTPSAP